MNESHVGQFALLKCQLMRLRYSQRYALRKNEHHESQQGELRPYRR